MTAGGPSINAVASSSSAAGLGGAPAGSTVQNCPLNGPPASGASISAAPSRSAQERQKPLEYCDIQQLTMVLSSGSKSATIVVDRDRKAEPVDPSKVPPGYVGALASHDLVVEALADVEDRTGEGSPSKTVNPLGVKLTAVNKVSHSSFAPAHPHTQLYVYNRPAALSDGGVPVEGQYFCPSGDGTSRTTWGFLWPFGPDREKRYLCEASSCGTLPIPQRTIERLAIDLVVLPYEEWTVEIGLTGTGGYSKETGRNRFNAQDGKSTRQVTRTTVEKKRVGSRETSTTTQKMETPTGQARTRIKSTDTTLDYQLLGSTSQATTNIKESWNKRVRTEKDDDIDARKITITRKIGGQTVATDVSGTVKNLLKIKELIDDLSKLFSSVKIGWSIAFSYELFAGNLSFGWGHRWPTAYREENRVYYVERFIKAGGTCDLVDGSVTGFFGFAVDPWYAPIAVEIGAYLTAKAKVSVSVSFDYRYTNAMLSPGGASGKLAPSASLGFEAGAKANGRAFGYSVESKLALETECTFELEGGLSTSDPPWVKGNLMLGKQNKADEKKADGLRLIGELVLTGSTVRRYQIDPIVLVNGMVVWTDRYFWGDPAEKKA